MKLLLDINIILDVLLDRLPWSVEAALLLTAVEEGRAEGYVAGHTVTTVHYIVMKERGSTAAATAVTDLLRIVGTVPLGDSDFQQALILGLSDFEDAVQAAAAMRIGATHLVTRNVKDVEGIPLPVMSAGEVLAVLEQ